MNTIKIVLNKAKIPYGEAISLLAHILKKTREWIMTYPEKTISLVKEKQFISLEKRRRNGEPIAYLLGEKEFFSLPFKVNRHTLIPRPETEILVEKGLEIITTSSKKKFLIVDVGTGSGCIIISLAKALDQKKNLVFFGFDFSSKALLIAKKNARNILKNKTGKINFLSADLLQIKNQPNFWFKNIADSKTEILILTNLPYVSKKEYAQLDRTVKNYEPRLALLSGIDGLDHYRKLFSQLKKISKDFPQNNFTLIFEFGWTQKPLLEKIIKANFPTAQSTFFKDLAQKWRVAKIELGRYNGK